jgi:hypothetical protein
LIPGVGGLNFLDQAEKGILDVLLVQSRDFDEFEVS